MIIETAQSTRQGNRNDNQDQAAIMISDTQALLIVADGMGGHADGGIAARAAVDSMSMSFKHLCGRVDAKTFLRKAMVAAHQAVYELGAERPVAERPRTTCTICLVDDGVAQWAHVGDSRVYWFHNNAVAARTRDHSMVEALYQAGRISDDEMLHHPMRNFVDECLGGDPAEPKFVIGEPVALSNNDIILLCTDGLWSALEEHDIVTALCNGSDFDATIEEITEQAETAADPLSDNVTAAALRWVA